MVRALVRLGSALALAWLGLAPAALAGCGDVEPAAPDAPRKPLAYGDHATPPVWDTRAAAAAGSTTCDAPAALHVHHDAAGRADRLHAQLDAQGSLGEFLVDTGSLKSYLTRSGDGTDATASTTIFCRSMTLPIIARLRPGMTPDRLPQAGVLGSDLVANGSLLDLDLTNGHLSLYEAAPDQPRPARAMVVPIELRNGWLIASGIKVEGREVKLIVDTGASNVIVLGKTPRPGEVREDTVDGTASAITLFHADGNVDLGDGIIRHVPVDRTDSFPTLEGLIESLGGDVAGLLGLTSLGRERIIIGKASMMLVLPPVAPRPL